MHTVSKKGEGRGGVRKFFGQCPKESVVFLRLLPQETNSDGKKQLHVPVTCPMEMDFLGSLTSVISLARRLSGKRLSGEMAASNLLEEKFKVNKYLSK